MPKSGEEKTKFSQVFHAFNGLHKKYAWSCGFSMCAFNIFLFAERFLVFPFFSAVFVNDFIFLNKVVGLIKQTT